MAVRFVSMDLFALATLPTRADEAKGTATTNFYALPHNLRPAGLIKGICVSTTRGVLMLAMAMRCRSGR
jgi:hypothetical protein